MPSDGSRAGTQQQLIRFRASDGFLVNALLLTRDGEASSIRDRPMLLQVHGSLGHFLARGTPGLLPHALAERAIDSLSINTRLASAGQITGEGIFPDTSKDIEAAVRFLTEAGFKRIFVLGYSLGASMVVHWAAETTHSAVHGLVLEGCPYSIPASKLERWRKYGASPTYEEVYARAKELLGDDPYNSPDDEIFVAYQSIGPTPGPGDDEIFTYKTWWFLCGPEAFGPMAYRHIAKINLPMVLMRGEADPLVAEWVAEALATLVREAGNRNVIVVRIPAAHPSAGAQSRRGARLR
jgi:pimeloyl-ACP methyl ester carboxylesterase